MNTSFVGVKEFRANLSEYAKRARKGDTRFVVVNHNTPLFEVTPFAEDKTLDTLVADIVKAERDIDAGRYVTHERVLKELQ